MKEGLDWRQRLGEIETTLIIEGGADGEGGWVAELEREKKTGSAGRYRIRRTH